MHPRTSIATALLLAGSVLAACGAADVESSDEYVDLLDERDSLATELDEVRAELDEVDDRLAVAEAALDEAETGLVDGTATSDDLRDFLVLDVMNRVGLSPSDAECVADAFVSDREIRQAYLVLIDPSQTDATATETAYGRVTTIMEDCGLEIAQDDPAVSAETLAALGAVLGDVEVVGDPLPQFADGTPDTAIGTTAPVIVGADYTGSPVTVDAATDGPTMVLVVAHWCPHCNAELPKINQLRDDGRIPDGVNVVAVSSGLDPDRSNFPPDRWLVDMDWTLPVVADGLDGSGSFIASAAYGTAGVPFGVLIDGDGVVTERWAGERSIDELAAALGSIAD